MKRTGKNNLIYLMALILVIIAFIVFATYGMLDGSKDEEWYPVSVIVENSSSDRFTSFREGLERGAEDYHIRLNVVSTGAFSGIEEEYQIIHREIDNGAKGVIVEMCDSSNYPDDSAVEIGSDKMILVETDVEAEGMYAAILPQSYEMGKAVKIVDLATRMIELAGYRPGEDIKIEFTGLRPGEKLYEEVLSDKENTIPTENKKIMIAKVRRYEYADILDTYAEFERLSRAVKIMDTVRLMKKIVPEFKSKNSPRFEVLDKE